MRFRPLRSSPTSEAELSAVTDPPATMRAAVIEAPATQARCTRRSSRCPAPCSASSCARRGGRGQSHRRQDPRRLRSVGGDRRSIRPCSASTSAASSSARPTSPTPSRRAPRSSAWLPSPDRAARTPSTCSCPSLSVARKPASLSHVEAAGVPLAALTAWGLVVETAHAHEGQRILIHAGSGGVGHFAVQFAAYFGAHVTATGSARNALMAARLGASVGDRPHLDRFEDVVSEVDVVIDLVGDAARPHRPALAAGHPPAAASTCWSPPAAWPGLRARGGRRGSAGDGLQGHPRRRRARHRRTAPRLGRRPGLHRQGVRPAGRRRRPRGAREGPHAGQDRAARQRRLTAGLDTAPAPVALRRRPRRPQRRAARNGGSTAASTAARRQDRRPRAHELAVARAPPPTGTSGSSPQPSRARTAVAKSWDAGTIVPRRSRRIGIPIRAAIASAGRRVGRSRRPALRPSVSGVDAARHPALHEGGRRDRLVPHRSEHAHAASGHRRGTRCHRTHHGARLEQAGGEILIVAVELRRRPDAAPRAARAARGTRSPVSRHSRRAAP